MNSKNPSIFKLKSLKIDLSVTRIANVHYFEFLKNSRTISDNHPFRELLFIDSGAVKVESNDFDGILKSKELIIHKSNEPHSFSCVGETAPNVVIIGFECASSKLDFFSDRVTSLTADLAKMLADVVREGQHVFLPPYNVPNTTNMKKRHSRIYGADQMLKIKLEAFLINLIRESTTTPWIDKKSKNNGPLAEIVEYIGANYNRKITLDDLCVQFNTNKTTLCKNFREAYGSTIIQYINNLRIKHAKALLREENISITQIASMVGFDSVHYFSNTFKKFENKSPLEYINTIKSQFEEIEKAQ